MQTPTASNSTAFLYNTKQSQHMLALFLSVNLPQDPYPISEPIPSG